MSGSARPNIRQEANRLLYIYIPLVISTSFPLYNHVQYGTLVPLVCCCLLPVILYHMILSKVIILSSDLVVFLYRALPHCSGLCRNGVALLRATSEVQFCYLSSFLLAHIYEYTLLLHYDFMSHWVFLPWIL